MNKIIEIANNYIKWDPIPQSAEQIKQLIDNNDIKTLTDILSTRIAFGTAGIIFKNKF